MVGGRGREAYVPAFSSEASFIDLVPVAVWEALWSSTMQEDYTQKLGL